MSRFESFEFDKDQSFERDTATRFSLADNSINRRDVLRGTEKKSERFVEYYTPTNLPLEIRSNLIAKHDILGSLVNSSDSSKDSFKIPYGAKPILYGAISRNSGDYSYGDADLFYDLGVLLNHFDNSLVDSDKKIFFKGVVGINVALVDFTSQHEKGLFLVPGCELYSQVTSNESDNLAYYVEKLQTEFERRFNNPNVSQKFIDGYNLIKNK